MKRPARLIPFIAIMLACASPAARAQHAHTWLDDPNVFPIAVWLQDPANAPRYRAAGINLYVGLWKGPTERQLADLKKDGMHVICEQNAVGLHHRDDSTIAAWMHGDEPDNAQPISGGGYGPPIAPAKIVDEYNRYRRTDPTRPVMLNLGQGVAWDGYYGRGVRSNHPEDYPLYIKGCDIVSFDIYPGCSTERPVAGKLWLVADGVRRLHQWAGGEKRVWNCIECTNIGNAPHRASPAQVRAEVWMSLISGSQGLIYFVHVFKPHFIEAGLLSEPAMLQTITATNHQIADLAPVLNSPTLPNAATVDSVDAKVPVEVIAKSHAGSLYLFAVCMRNGSTTATFHLPAIAADTTAEVLGEHRNIKIQQGRLVDAFGPWAVHLYCIRR